MNIPKWVNFIATNYNGMTWGYAMRPSKSHVLMVWDAHCAQIMLDPGKGNREDWETTLTEVEHEKDGEG